MFERDDAARFCSGSQFSFMQDAGYRKEIADMLFYSEYTINNELCKVSSVLKGKFPYLEWLRLKKHNSKEILQLAKQLHII
jgi:two-component system, NarL family, response regulator DevR